MSLIFPNPPADVASSDSFFDGRSFLYNANISGYGGSGFATQLGNWTGMSTAAGTIDSPTYSVANQVTAIPREVRRAPGGVAADSPGWQVGTSAGNPNSILFPGATNDAGIKMTLVGGIDQNASVLVGTEFLFGLSDGTVNFPGSVNTLATAARAWCGLYSESASNQIFLGYKNAAQAIVILDGPLDITWTTFQGFFITIDINPVSRTTSITFKKLVGLGLWSTLSNVRTTQWNPGRIPIAPTWRCRKNNAADVQSSWISNVLIQSYYLGAFSL